MQKSNGVGGGQYDGCARREVCLLVLVYWSRRGGFRVEKTNCFIPTENTPKPGGGKNRKFIKKNPVYLLPSFSCTLVYNQIK